MQAGHTILSFAAARSSRLLKVSVLSTALGTMVSCCWFSSSCFIVNLYFLGSTPRHCATKSTSIPSMCSISLVIGGSSWFELYQSMSIFKLPLLCSSSSGEKALFARFVGLLPDSDPTWRQITYSMKWFKSSASVLPCLRRRSATMT